MEKTERKNGPDQYSDLYNFIRQADTPTYVPNQVVLCLSGSMALNYAINESRYNCVFLGFTRHLDAPLGRSHVPGPETEII